MYNIKIIDRKKFLGTLIFFVVIFIFVSVLLVNQTIVSSKCNEEYITIIASNGDTLWRIAEKYNYYNNDIREVVFNIMDYNNLETANIFLGQELKIPIY